MSVKNFQQYFSSITKKLLLCFCLLNVQNVFAQNLVPNGNFEVYSSLNLGYGDLYRAIGWDNVNGVTGLNPPFASPDYYNNLGTILNFWSPIAPISGHGQAGFCTYQDSIPGLYGYDFREYLSCNLSAALTPNKKYKVSFSLTSGGAPPVYTRYTNHVGVHFSTTPLSQMTYKVIPVVPQIDVPTIMYLTGIWQTYSFNYFPQSAFTRITIGNFFDDANTLKTGAGMDAYYFIDSITISAANYPIYTNNCLGDSSSFNLADITNLLSVNWIFGDTLSGLNNFSTSINPKHYYQNPGTYSVQSINHYATFTDTFNFNITIYPPPQITLGNDTVLCNADSIILYAGNNFDTYLWSDSSTLDSLIINSTGVYYVKITSNGCANSDTIVVSNLSVNLGNDTLICIGDSITLHAGVSFQNYLWSNGLTSESISVSQQGFYSVIASVNGCQVTDSVIVQTKNCSLEVSFSVSDTSICQYSCVDFYDLSMNNPITWQWTFYGADSTTSNLKNPTNICYSNFGNHDVKLVACNNYGCDTLFLTNFIHIDSLPQVHLGNDTTSCDRLVLNSGINNASYLWSNGKSTKKIIVHTSGSYSVLVTDTNGCSNADTVNVIINPLPVVELGNDTSTCNAPIQLDAGSTNVSYQWSTGDTTQTIQVNSSSLYGVVVTDINGCSNADSISITINPLPVVTFNAFSNSDTLCISSGLQTINSGNPSGGIFSGAGVTGNQFDPNITGTGMQYITYQYTDSNGCYSSATDSVWVDLCLGINSISKEEIFIIYPNPITSNSFHIGYLLPLNKSGTFQLIDINGRIVIEYNLLQGSIQHKLTLPQLANGIYNATIISDNKRMNKTIAIIKQ